MIRNKKNQTPADVLLEEKPQGWEETLHYYNTFKPGTRTNGRGVGCGEKGIIIVEFKGFLKSPSPPHPLPSPVFKINKKLFSVNTQRLSNHIHVHILLYGCEFEHD